MSSLSSLVQPQAKLSTTQMHYAMTQWVKPVVASADSLTVEHASNTTSSCAHAADAVAVAAILVQHLHSCHHHCPGMMTLTATALCNAIVLQ